MAYNGVVVPSTLRRVGVNCVCLTVVQPQRETKSGWTGWILNDEEEKMESSMKHEMADNANAYIM